MDLYPRIYAFAVEHPASTHARVAGWGFTESERDHTMLTLKPSPASVVSEFDLVLPPGMMLTHSMAAQITELVYDAVAMKAYHPTLRYTVPDPQAAKDAWTARAENMAMQMRGADSMFGVFEQRRPS